MRKKVFAQSMPQSRFVIDGFGGVDFFSDPSKVQPRRSPDAVNMIADNRFFPVKRTGYKCLKKYPGTVHGIFGFEGKQKRELLIHAGRNLYRFDPATGRDALLMEYLADEDSTAFLMDGKCWLLDSQHYLCYDGERVFPVTEEVYVPTTVTGRHAQGGGKALESPNMLGPGRINSFTADGTATAFHLDAKKIDSAAVEAKVGDALMQEGSGFTVDRENGVVTFSHAPADDHGIDSVKITFAKSVQGALEKILHCTIASVYGGRNHSRVFLSGNPDYPNVDWHSGSGDPGYIPADSDTAIGADSSAIMGYLRKGEDQIILKACGTDSGQYLRSGEFDREGNQIFPVRQGSVGVGAISKRGLAILEDEPLFLSDSGIYACTGRDVREELSPRSRSRLIDRRLLGESHPERAVGCVFEGKYYLSINNHCYVADGRQKYREESAGVSYEWYFWDNIPAGCFAVWERRLYFGTADGRLCRFCLPGEDGAYLDDGKAIRAYWKTPLLSLGDNTRFKNIRQTAVTAMPYLRSGFSVSYSGNQEWMRKVYEGNIDLFSWEKLDFSRFSFRSIPSPMVRVIRERSRHVTVFQVTVENNRPGEPFGLLAIEIDYTVGGGVR